MIQNGDRCFEFPRLTSCPLWVRKKCKKESWISQSSTTAPPANVEKTHAIKLSFGDGWGWFIHPIYGDFGNGLLYNVFTTFCPFNRPVLTWLLPFRAFRQPKFNVGWLESNWWNSRFPHRPSVRGLRNSMADMACLKIGYLKTQWIIISLTRHVEGIPHVQTHMAHRTWLILWGLHSFSAVQSLGRKKMKQHQIKSSRYVFW